MFGRRPILGIDIGTHSVKCAVMETARVRDLWSEPLLPERAAQSDQVGDDRIRETIETVMIGLRARNPGLPRSVVTAIGGEHAFCQYLELPAIDPRELDVAVSSITRKYVPFPMDTMAVQFMTVPALEPDENKTAVFVAAASKQAVEHVRALISSCGLDLLRLDVTPLALVREYVHNQRDRLPGEVALVHVGFQRTTVVVVRGCYPYYVRDFELGGRDFTYGLQMGAQSSWEEAERHKLTNQESTVDTTVEPFLQSWLDQMHRTMEHYVQRFENRQPKIEKVLLSGGSSLLTGLSARLSARLDGVRVELDDWNAIELADKKQRSRPAVPYKVAVGLALEA